MLEEMILAARADKALWLPDLRAAFETEKNASDLILRLHLHRGEILDFSCRLPRWETDEERALVRAYLLARVYNLLSVYSGQELCFYRDGSDGALNTLLGELDLAFQLNEEKRMGYGKVINIANRISRAFGGEPFRFTTAELSDFRPAPGLPAAGKTDLRRTLMDACDRAQGQCLCGVDVGGTDVKLAISAGGKLLAVKEYDWNPAASPTAEGIVEPILLLVRLLRACAAAELAGERKLRARLEAALRKHASDGEIRAAAELAEATLGQRVQVLDGVGVSFPDIVIANRIVGGETPKTDGMRHNTEREYEAAFAELGQLETRLLALCVPGAQVHLTNDGNMAAFTAAAELAASPDADAVRRGVVAHTLGTDLGSGWLLPDGTIPPLPLELYDLILDLGSAVSAAYDPRDLRSTRNANSGLPGARRYMGQAAAYRLAQQLDSTMLEGFTTEAEGVLDVILKPQDLRKACLAHLMALADAGKPEAEEIFRRIGLHLAVVSREMDQLLHPQTQLRFLFGRFVKSPRCFELLCEGFSCYEKEMRLVAPDENLACTPLMKQLARRGDVTVAQFGQAIGAIYYAAREPKHEGGNRHETQ